MSRRNRFVGKIVGQRLILVEIRPRRPEVGHGLPPRLQIRPDLLDPPSSPGHRFEDPRHDRAGPHHHQHSRNRPHFAPPLLLLIVASFFPPELIST